MKLKTLKNPLRAYFVTREHLATVVQIESDVLSVVLQLWAKSGQKVTDQCHDLAISKRAHTYAWTHLWANPT